MDVEPNPRFLAADRVVRSVAWALLALATAAPWLAWAGVWPGRTIPQWGLSVVGDHVVLGYDVGRVLLVVAFALLAIWSVVRWNFEGSRRVEPRRRRSGRGLRVAGVVLALMSTCAGCVAHDGAEYFLLPAGPGGCLVVVRESAFLIGGQGAAYVLPAGGGKARRVGAWDVDDGGRPIRSGQFELTWAADGGTLEVTGDFHAPAFIYGNEDPLRIDCR